MLNYIIEIGSQKTCLVQAKFFDTFLWSHALRPSENGKKLQATIKTCDHKNVSVIKCCLQETGLLGKKWVYSLTHANMTMNGKRHEEFPFRTEINFMGSFHFPAIMPSIKCVPIHTYRSFNRTGTTWCVLENVYCNLFLNISDITHCV